MTKQIRGIGDFMDSYKSIKNDPKIETVTVTLSGRHSITTRVMRFLAVTANFGDVGHSGKLAMDVDGDGEDRLKVSGVDMKPYLSGLNDKAYSSDVIVHDDSFEATNITRHS